MPAKLKPCPFCGFDVESEESYKDPVNPSEGLYEDEIIYVIACPDCGAGVAPGSTLIEAVNNWNKRAGQGEEKISQSATPTNSESKTCYSCSNVRLSCDLDLAVDCGDCDSYEK